MKSRHPAVMLIREPNENDLQLFHNDSRSLLTFLEQDDTMEVDEAQEPEDCSKKSSESVPRLGIDAAKDIYLEDVGRVIPQWTPDRNLPNLIFSIIDQAGKKGMSNLVSPYICLVDFLND
jgi:transcription factor C subunit 3